MRPVAAVLRAGLSCVLCVVLLPALAADPRAAFVGSWDLVAVENRGSDGSVTRPFGDAPRGRITYTPEGFLSAHVMRAARPAFGGGATLYDGTPDEKAAAYDSYIAYYGRYAVDAAARTVTHRIEGSLFPNWSGSAQTRHFAFEGDTLTLRSPPFESGGKTLEVHVVWRRAQGE